MFGNIGKFGKSVVPVVLVSVVVFTSACKNSVIESSWTADAIIIDGKIEDWEGKPTMYFEDEKAVIGVCNDAERLYVAFRTRDHKLARIISMSGLTLYFDVRGKESKDFALRFRPGPPPRPPFNEQGDFDSDDARRQRDRYRQRSGDSLEPTFTCFIKNRISEKDIPFDGSEGPSAAFDTSFGFYSYELSVPLAKGAVRYFGLGIEPGQIVGIGAEYGGRPNMMSMPDRPGGMRSGGFGGGSGGRDGGGFGGRGGRGRSGDRPSMPTRQEIWIKARLAIRAETIDSPTKQ